MSELVSLDDWNAAHRGRQQSGAINPPNGIACPQCGQEMCDSGQSRVLTSMPPITQAAVFCGCGYQGWRNQK